MVGAAIVLIPVAALALVAVVANTPLPLQPLPGVTTEGAAQRGDPANDASQSDQPPATTTPVTTATQAPTDKPHRGQVDTGEEQEGIRVLSLPPVDVQRDWADQAYLVFNVLLLVSGAFQIWLLYRTWDATAANADAAGKNADAAKANADAAARSVDLAELALMQAAARLDFTAEMKNGKVRILVENLGPSPAHVLGIAQRGVRYEDIPAKAETVTGHEFALPAFPFTGNMKPSVLCDMDIPPRQSTTDTGMAYGWVAFEDIYGRRYRTGFGFVLTNNDTRVVKFMDRAYNYRVRIDV